MRTTRKLIAIPILVLAIFLQGCGPSTTKELKSDLNKAAALLNAAAKENRLLYQQRVFGDRALEIRKKVAGAIGDANDALSVALAVAKGMTPGTLTMDKAQILDLLGQVVNSLAAVHVGDDRIDLLLQAVAASVNSAIVLVQALKSVDLRYVTPELRGYSLPVVSAERGE